MKSWLIGCSFVGFVFLWMAGRIESGWALLVFGVCWGLFVIRWAWLWSDRGGHEGRRRR